MNGNNNQDAVAKALKSGSDAVFSLEQAFLDNGDQANADAADEASRDLLNASGKANAASVVSKLSDTQAHQQVVQQLTAKLNAAAQHIAADEKTVHKWLNVAASALQLVAKASAGNIPGAIANATGIIHLLS